VVRKPGGSDVGVAVDWYGQLTKAGYEAEPELVQMLEVSQHLHRPLLLEGPAGVGKTALAAALATVLHRPMIRLQCYEGLEASQALYDWNYHRQMAALTRHSDEDVFTRPYLLSRPLLQALECPQGAVLLLDEVDRADESFEALLLEFLSDFHVTIPELGTLSAKVDPVVLLTSNRTRPLSDALRRRCLYHFFDWPSKERECAIVQLHFPELSDVMCGQFVSAVQFLRSLNLVKIPGMAETLDWVAAFLCGDQEWTVAWIAGTLGCVLKDPLDLAKVRPRLEELWTAT
jgi:MoxR-like ATPase